VAVDCGIYGSTDAIAICVTGIDAQPAPSRPRTDAAASLPSPIPDIGKASIPRIILEKPSPLTRDEMAMMSKHPEYGLEALRPRPEWTGNCSTS
jgi:hypothetical protein